MPGPRRPRFGAYHLRDGQFVAALDVAAFAVAAKTVGRDLSEMIVASADNTLSIGDLPSLGGPVTPTRRNAGSLERRKRGAGPRPRPSFGGQRGRLR